MGRSSISFHLGTFVAKERVAHTISGLEGVLGSSLFYFGANKMSDGVSEVCLVRTSTRVALRLPVAEGPWFSGHMEV